MKAIIWDNDDGTISTTPCPEEWTTKQINDHVKLLKEDPRYAPAYLTMTFNSIADVSDLPTSREFRNAWRKSGTKVVVDVDAAKPIHAKKLQVEREMKLKQLGKDEEHARLTGDSVTADSHASSIAAIQGQDLSAIGNQISNAPNITALKAITIPGL